MDEAQHDRRADARLTERLLRGGVGSRHVRRTLRELRDHREDLVERMVARGDDHAAAVNEARGLLGDRDALAEQMIARPELRSRVRRFAWLLFVLGPAPMVCAMGLLSLGLMAGVVQGVGLPGLNPAAEEALAMTIGRPLLHWIAPFLVGLQLCRTAVRRWVPAYWPVCAIAIVAFNSGTTYYGKLGGLTTLAIQIPPGIHAPVPDLVRIVTLFAVLVLAYMLLRAAQLRRFSYA